MSRDIGKKLEKDFLFIIERKTLTEHRYVSKENIRIDTKKPRLGPWFDISFDSFILRCKYCEHWIYLQSLLQIVLVHLLNTELLLNSFLVVAEKSLSN